MEMARGMAALFSVASAVAVLSSVAAGSAAVDQGGRPCFEACFDQCVPRDEFWFCQFSCYRRCAGGSGSRAVRGLGCEQSCARSVCGRLHPGSKMMAACRDTCRQSYAAAACSGGAAAV